MVHCPSEPQSALALPTKPVLHEPVQPAPMPDPMQEIGNVALATVGKPQVTAGVCSRQAAVSHAQPDGWELQQRQAKHESHRCQLTWHTGGRGSPLPV